MKMRTAILGIICLLFIINNLFFVVICNLPNLAPSVGSRFLVSIFAVLTVTYISLPLLGLWWFSCTVEEEKKKGKGKRFTYKFIVVFSLVFLLGTMLFGRLLQSNMEKIKLSSRVAVER